jgi:glycosyltransferase involved in cell wall biosynthesis
MKILHLNTHVSGGAAVASRRLHEGLLKVGVASVFGCAAGATAQWAIPAETPLTPRSVVAAVGNRVRVRCERRRDQGPKRTTYATDCRTRYRPQHLKRFLPFDIVNLHWIANFIDWETCLPWLAERAPIVWTLHDMNPCRGIWHYQPGESEQTGNRREWDQQVLDRKARSLACLADQSLTVVAPSHWLAAEAAASTLLGRFRVKVIPYGFDLNIFRPIEKAAARAALGLDVRKPVIGFLADGVSDPRKGYHLLVEALKNVAKPWPTLLTAGSGDPPQGDFECQHLGRIHSDALLRLFYSAIDLFICPSLQDNLPNTVLESMACGTPVVAFDIGGLPDMIRDGVSGWLVPPFNIAIPGETICRALSEPSHLEQLSRSCRRISEQEYCLTTQADRYRSLYNEITRPVS